MTTRIWLKPYSVNGTGIRLLDYRRVSADTYEATRWFTFFFVPLIPIGTWIIRPGIAEGRGAGMQYNFQIIGKRAMRWNRVGRLWMFNLLAAAPLTVCGIFETPGENTNMWFTLMIFSVLWAFATLIYAQRGGGSAYRAPEAQPLPTGNVGPRRAA